MLAPDDFQLEDVERAAVKLANEAGSLLRDRFRKALDVEYKDKKQETDPVTSADKDSEQLLREGISKEFPDHGILGEEGSEEGDTTSPDYLWVLDPLDGTTNFLNGLPIYAVSIAVLHKGAPVVGVVFVPWPNDKGGLVLHARRGGGSKLDGEPLTINSREGPKANRLSGLPGSFRESFRFSKGMHRSVGESRVTGSIAYELAMVAMGSVQYALFGAPKLWDVAAGILIVPEAGGEVMVRGSKGRSWEAPTILGPSWEGSPPTFKDLRSWAVPVIAGDALVVPTVAASLSRRRPSVRRRLARLVRRLRPTKGSKSS